MTQWHSRERNRNIAPIDLSSCSPPYVFLFGVCDVEFAVSALCWQVFSLKASRELLFADQSSTPSEQKKCGVFPVAMQKCDLKDKALVNIDASGCFWILSQAKRTSSFPCLCVESFARRRKTARESHWVVVCRAVRIYFSQCFSFPREEKKKFQKVSQPKVMKFSSPLCFCVQINWHNWLINHSEPDRYRLSVHFSCLCRLALLHSRKIMSCSRVCSSECRDFFFRLFCDREASILAC